MTFQILFKLHPKCTDHRLNFISQVYLHTCPLVPVSNNYCKSNETVMETAHIQEQALTMDVGSLSEEPRQLVGTEEQGKETVPNSGSVWHAQHNAKGTRKHSHMCLFQHRVRQLLPCSCPIEQKNSPFNRRSLDDLRA